MWVGLMSLWACGGLPLERLDGAWATSFRLLIYVYNIQNGPRPENGTGPARSLAHDHGRSTSLSSGKQKLIVSRLERLPLFYFVHVPPRCPIVRSV